MTPADLRAWRKQADLSQSELATALGVATMTVSRWERGSREIPSFLLLALDGLTANQALREHGVWLGQRPTLGTIPAEPHSYGTSPLKRLLNESH